MRILSLDPGSRCAGFAIIEDRLSSPHVLASGIFLLKEEDDFWKRIKLLVFELKKIIHEYQPTVVALESLIYVKNPNSLIKLAQSRGAMVGAVTEFDLPLFEYSPNAVKQVVTGHGHADKESIQKWVSLQTGIQSFKSHDESDAIAIALCHWFHHKNKIQLHQVKTKKKSGLAGSLQHAISKDLL